MYKYSEKSLSKISKMHPYLQLICQELIKIQDITIIDSLRSKGKQDNYYNAGKSQVKYPNSRHNKSILLNSTEFSDAMDIAIWHQSEPHIDWQKKEEWYYLAGLVLGIAHQLNIKIKWGGHFNNFFDGPHFELIT